MSPANIVGMQRIKSAQNVAGKVVGNGLGRKPETDQVRRKARLDRRQEPGFSSRVD